MGCISVTVIVVIRKIPCVGIGTLLYLLTLNSFLNILMIHIIFINSLIIHGTNINDCKVINMIQLLAFSIMNYDSE